MVALERHRGRARALVETCRRMHAGTVDVVVADAAKWHSTDRFDRVLVDPPCSGLGTLQSRPDLRWRASPDSIAELAEQELAILANAAGAVGAGGTLTYSVCTISRPESEEVLDRFLAGHPMFVPEDLGAQYPSWRHHRRRTAIQLLPNRDRTDGFFISQLRRQAD